VSREAIWPLVGVLARTPPPGDVDQLTERERDVVRGCTNVEVAEALYISEATVKTHLVNLIVKLGLRDRAAAIVYAHTNGLT
jgi:DNA-binding NarL/FixJ family response regulator